VPAAIRNYVLLFIGCLAFHLAGTWNLPLIDRDEPRFAEASREMIERGDFVVPFFNNEYRFDKPPLTYWFHVASYRVFGENDFAARFPTAIAGALVAVVLMAWGTRVGHAAALGQDGSWRAGSMRYERNSEACATGVWAAVLFTLCLQTFLHGKAAVADMWLVLFVTLAHWAGWELLRGGNARFFWVLYPSLALGFLAKGPIAWTPLLTIASTRHLFDRQRRGAATTMGPREQYERAFHGDPTIARVAQESQRLFFIPGSLLAIALVCAWAVPALQRTRGEFFYVGIGRHVIARSFAPMEGHGANSLGAYLALSPLYFVTVFASFFPWSIKLPALVRNMRLGHRDASDNFLLAGTLTIFLIFTLVKTKLPHYTLPAFPLLALLMARRWQRLKLSRAMAWCAAVLFLAIALIAPPFISRLTPSKMLANASRAVLRGEMQFAAAEYTEPSLVWYFRRDVHGFMTPLKVKEAAGFFGQRGPRFIIVPTKSVPKLFPRIEPEWRIFRAQGWDIAKAARVDVTMVAKENDE